MPEEDKAAEAAAEEQEEKETPEAEEKAAEEQEEEKSPEEFDADKAKAKIKKANNEAANLRKRLKELEPLAKKAKELEDAQKSESEKLTEAKSTAEKQAAEAAQEAARLRVALKKGLTETQAKRLVGDSEEELETDADELLASFKPAEEEKEEKESPEDTRRRPKEKLRPGAVKSADPEETDPRKLAEGLPSFS
jgi:hypothetical protein